MSTLSTRYLLLILAFSHHPPFIFFFFFNDTATTEIYTLSLHDALPIWIESSIPLVSNRTANSSRHSISSPAKYYHDGTRSEEHTSELQSLAYLVCRLLLEKKKKNNGLRSQEETE